MIDSLQNKDYRQCFELFQSEIKNLLASNQRQQKELESLNAQFLLSEQVRLELEARNEEYTQSSQQQIA